MISGFLSAIDSFASKIADKGIDSISFGKNKIFYRNVPLNQNSVMTVICVSDVKDDEKRVSETLNVILKKFFEIYQVEDLLKWDGNVLKFMPFQKVVERLTTSLTKNLSLESAKPSQPAEAVHLSLENFERSVFAITDEQLKAVYLEEIPSVRHWIRNYLQKLYSEIQFHVKKNSNSIFQTIIPDFEKGLLISVFAKQFPFNSELIKTGFVFLFNIVSYKNQILLTRCGDQSKENILRVYKNFVEVNPKTEQEAKEFVKNINETINIIGGCSISGKLLKSQTELTLLHFKNFEDILAPAITGTPIAIMGDNTEAVSLVGQLSIMCPNRIPRISENVDLGSIEQGSIAIFPLTEEKRLKGVGIPIINLKTKAIQDGVKNKYCSRLANKFKELRDSELIFQYSNKELNNLISKVNMVIDVIWLEGENKLNKNTIAQIRSDLIEDQEILILALVRENCTKLQKLVDLFCDKLPLQNLILDNNFAKFGEKRVLVYARLSEQEIEAYFNRIIDTAKMFLGDRAVNQILARL